ncbi:TPA: phosphonate ABC transporter ATP-binding protein [Escherichia coli]
MQTIIRVEKLAKTFNQHQALHAVDLNIHHGEMVALLGPSGSGKSTLLRHLSGLITGDKSAGSHIELLGRTVQREGRLARDIRKSRANTGYIFQQFNLVNRLSVLENVLIGALGSTPFWRTCFSWFTREQKQRALQALTRVGMVHFAHQRVSTLSGGQQQRVAIARALMQQAKVILADEPIASLDPESARIVMDTLRRAIDQLVEKGWVQRCQGVGVLVLMRPFDYPLNAQARFSQNLLDQGSHPTSEKLLSVLRPASGHVADALGITEGENVIHLRTLRRVNGVALCLIDHYFADLTLWPTLQRFDSGSLHDFLREQTGIALRRSQTRISARRAQAKECQRLEIPNMSPLLCVRTLNHRDGESSPAEYSVSLTRADMIEFTMEH